MSTSRSMAVLIAILGILLVGCPSPTVTGSVASPNRGSVTVNITAPTGLMPHTSPLRHKISGLGPQGASFEREVGHSSAPSVTIVDLPVGAWTVTVVSENDLEESLGLGTTTTTVEVNQTSVVEVEVAPHSDQTGTLAISLSWQGLTLTTPNVVATLVPSAGNALNLDFSVGTSNATSGSLVPVGEYTLLLKAMDDTTLVSAFIETVKIAGKLTTKGDYTIDELGKVAVNMPTEATPDLQVNLTGASSSKLAHRTLELEAAITDDSVNAAVVWYVDNNAVAVGPQFSFGDTWPVKQSAVPYTVRAVAYTADGQRTGMEETQIAITPVFKSVWKTDIVYASSSDERTIKLPYFSSTLTHYDYTVEWGDGTSSTITPASTAADVVHQYATAGTYTVVLYGTFKGWTNLNDRKKLLRIESWGPLNLGNFGSYFLDCSNLTITATDALDLTGTTNLASAFANCTSLTTIPGIGEWDVSEVTNLSSTFAGAKQFEADLSGWNVGKVTTMNKLFRQAFRFNGDVGNWNTEKVTDMLGLFTAARVFNHPLNWNTSSVVTMAQMFTGADAFNQDLAWDTSQVTNMANMFSGAIQFNGNIADWDTSKVTDMSSMFSGASSFNGNISGWDTGAVTTMESLFENAIAFNRDITTWNTSQVASMKSTFRKASAFNQDLGGWSVTGLINASLVFESSGLSSTNYGKILTAWAAQAIKDNVSLGASPIRYPASAAAARQTLVTNKNWIISDGGQEP